MSRQQQGLALFSAILVLAATCVVIQLWLLTVSLEAILRHDTHTAIPAAISSTVLLTINAGLLRYVLRFDREVQRHKME
jgi:hypothetical protein